MKLSYDIKPIQPSTDAKQLEYCINIKVIGSEDTCMNAVKIILHNQNLIEFSENTIKPRLVGVSKL